MAFAFMRDLIVGGRKPKEPDFAPNPDFDAAAECAMSIYFNGRDPNDTEKAAARIEIEAGFARYLGFPHSSEAPRPNDITPTHSDGRIYFCRWSVNEAPYSKESRMAIPSADDLIARGLNKEIQSIARDSQLADMSGFLTSEEVPKVNHDGSLTLG